MPPPPPCLAAQVETAIFPAGAGQRSFAPANQPAAPALGSLMFRSDAGNGLGTDGYSRLSFASDFTLEVFFKTDGASNSSGPMTLLEQNDTVNGLSYALDLNTASGSPGALRFAVRGSDGITTTTPEVRMSTRDYADGNWHYAVAKFDKDSTGASSRSMLMLKVHLIWPSLTGPVPW